MMTLGYGHFRSLAGALLVCAIALSSDVIAQQQEPLPTTYPGIRLVTPAQGVTVRPGQNVPITIDVDPALNASSVLIAGNLFETGISLAMDGPPFTGTLKIPRNLAGSIELAMIVLGADRKSVGGLGINLNVVPEDTPHRLDMPHSFHLKLPPSTFLGSRTVWVKGLYDGFERIISDPITGTTYRSTDSGVVTVDAHGVLTPLAPGQAFIVVEHHGIKGFAEVEVEGNGKTSRDFPPIEHTADVSITAGAPRKQPDSVRYTMEVIIRNDSALPLALPLHLVINGLAEGVRVDGKKTEHIKPIGSPCVLVSAGEQDFLSPGNSTQVTVEFINFDDKPLRHKLRLFSGRP